MQDDPGRRSPSRAVSRLALLALAAGALLVVFPAGASSAPRNQPQRDFGRGHWFVHTCTAAPAGAAACAAQVVTNSFGTPLAGAAPAASSYGPAQFHTAYGLPTTAATPETIAIVDAYDDPNAASDLAAYDTNYGLPQLNTYASNSTPSPWFRKVNQTGGTAPPPANSGWGLEIALDIETAHEICQNCNILLVEATSNSFANLGTAENEAVALGGNVVSNSWGGGESSNETTAYDPYFNHPGVVITASTGDSGYGVEYPAASQYVVGVGGTTLHLNADNTYLSESAWVGGGSGCSAYEPKPSWQTDACSHHTVADVSADADPNTGAAVYDSYGYGGWLQVGGTSLASPLIASVFALSGNTSDRSAPYSHPNQLHDVTTGSNSSSCGGNYLCAAGPGYDGPTGLGTPNGLGAFMTAPPTPDYSLSASPSSQTVAAGSGTSYTITLTAYNGYSGTVSLTGATGAPSGASVDLSHCQALTTVAPSCVANVSTSGTTPSGSSTLTFDGSDGTISHTASATLVVQGQDFSLSISPTSQSLRTPGSVHYTLTITDIGGFGGTVGFTVSGLPAGLTASFSSSSQTSATLTLTATSRLARHSYTFTVTGSASGVPSHSVNAMISLR